MTYKMAVGKRCTGTRKLEQKGHEKVSPRNLQVSWGEFEPPQREGQRVKPILFRSSKSS